MICISTAKDVDKAWGCERHIHNSEYCLKILGFVAHHKLSLHFHRRKDEVWYVLDGRYQLTEVDPKTTKRTQTLLESGAVVYIPPCSIHGLYVLESGRIIEASTHDDPNDSYRIEPSE